MRTLKKTSFITIIALILILGLFCKKEEKNDKEGLGLFLLLQSQQSQQNQSNGSGFMIRIPDGIAK